MTPVTEGSRRRPAARRPAARPLRVTVCDGRGRRLRVPGLAPWLASVAPASARGEVTVALVSDGHMRSLNRRYRGVAHATDVLSFPTDEDAPDAPLGDIVIARGVAARQARGAGHALVTELKLLSLHGLLHLLGYDHETDAGTMARVEARLRRRGGLAVGLIERHRARRTR